MKPTCTASGELSTKAVVRKGLKQRWAVYGSGAEPAGRRSVAEPPLEDELPTSAPEHIYGTTLLTTIYFIHYDGMADN